MPFIIDAVYSYMIMLGLVLSMVVMVISAAVACGGILMMTLGKFGWGVTAFFGGSFFTFLLFEIVNAIMKGVL